MRHSISRVVAVFSFSFAVASTAFSQSAGKPSEQLGKVEFPNSCSPAVQEKFLRGVAMLHSFWWSAGERTFEEVAAEDHSCGIAAWGFASILMSNPLAGSGASPKDAPRAQAAIDKGRKMGEKTQRERDYIEAVAAYYEDFANRPERARQLSRAKAFEALAAKYPDDNEAQIFYAVYLAATQVLSDQSYSAYLKAAGILEKQFAKYPDHPGIAHYLIHSYDAPPIAQQGLPAARRYAQIAPDAPHALHMPSHIFTRVGAWKDSIESNRASARSGGDKSFDKWHANDYMVYAHLQLAQHDAAREIVGDAQRNPARIDHPGTAYAYAAMPARLALERGAWKEAAAIELFPAADAFPWKKYTFAEAVNAYARGLGAAMSGDAAGARVQVARLQALGEATKVPYWIEQIAIQADVVQGLAARAEGGAAQALPILRKAADREDATEKHAISPGPLVPARELLAYVELEAGDAQSALRNFEFVLQREPNRYRAIAGAARAAERAGDRKKAAAYSKRLPGM